MHFTCAWHTKAIYVSKFQVNTVTNIADIRQNVFSHARVMVIGVRSDLNTVMYYAISFEKMGNTRCKKEVCLLKMVRKCNNHRLHVHTNTRQHEEETTSTT